MYMAIDYPLARHSLVKWHMQTAWIRMRGRATRRLIRIQAVLHADNIFTNFESWSKWDGVIFSDPNGCLCDYAHALVIHMIQVRGSGKRQWTAKGSSFLCLFTDKGTLKLCLEQLEHLWKHLVEYRKRPSSGLSDIVILGLTLIFCKLCFLKSIIQISFKNRAHLIHRTCTTMLNW